MRPRVGVVAITIAAAVLAATYVHAGTDISADRLEREGTRYFLEGSVRITKGEITVRSDRAVYDQEAGTIDAEGAVLVNAPAFTAEATSGALNLAEQTGTLEDAKVRFRMGDFRVEAATLQMRDKDRFILKKASVTTCRDAPPDWCIRGSTVDVLIGERVAATNARLRLGRVPVFYTPYIWVPIVTERRTGLLPPRLGYRDSTGLYISQPLFWAISVNRDATFTLDYHAREAFGQGLEYRYIEAPHIKGRWNIYHLEDTEHAKDFVEIRGTHRQDGRVAGGFLNVNAINREDYYRLYEPYLEESSRRYLASRGEAYLRAPERKPMGNSRLYVAAAHYQDLKEGVDKETVLQREPEAGVFLSPFGPGPLKLSGRARGVNFHRKTGPDGKRGDLEAGASYTLGSALVLRQEARAERHAYEIDEGTLKRHPGFSEHTYRADLGLAADRAYGTVTHTVEPSLSYEVTDMQGEPPALLDIVETAEDSEIAALDLMNRFRGGSGGLISLRLRQPYDLRAEEDPWLPLGVDLSARQPTGPVSVTSSLSYSHTEDRLESMDTNASLEFSRLGLTGGQHYDRAGHVESYSGRVSYKASGAIEVFAGTRYDASEEKGLEETSAGTRYMSQCWGVKLTYVKRPEDYSVFIEARLLGIGGFDFN
jgi:hypothetical protein